MPMPEIVPPLQGLRFPVIRQPRASPRWSTNLLARFTFAGAEEIPTEGHVVQAWQSFPDGFAARFVGARPVDVAAQLGHHAHHLWQLGRCRWRWPLLSHLRHRLPFRGFEDRFAVQVRKVSTQADLIQRAPRDQQRDRKIARHSIQERGCRTGTKTGWKARPQDSASLDPGVRNAAIRSGNPA